MNLERMKRELARLQAIVDLIDKDGRTRHSIPYMCLFGKIARLQGAIEVLENGFLL